MNIKHDFDCNLSVDSLRVMQYLMNIKLFYFNNNSDFSLRVMQYLMNIKHVYLDAKTSIIEHYKKYGAKQVGLTNRMLFETNEARNLIERYYEKEKR